MKQVKTVRVTWREIQDLWAGYKTWKSVLSRIAWVRGANMPEGLSEAIVCICTKGDLIKSKHGDVLLKDGAIGEVKATSLPIGKKDLSSFSPKAQFDKLFFVEILSEDDGTFLVYDLGMSRSEVEKIKVNKTTTLKQQATSGKRPRFSIREEIIKATGIKPKWKVDVPNKKVSPI